MVNNWLKNAQHLLFPAQCLLCGARGQADLDLCPACQADLPVNRHCCLQCGLPLPPAAGTPRCGHCLRRRPPYAGVAAPFLYQEPLAHLIHALKFRGQLGAARLLGTLLAQELRGRADCPELIIPVPLHAARLRERGFNQALEIARPVGRALGVAVDAHSCVRVRATPSQMGLGARQRLRNLRGAFVVDGKVAARHVAIVDDVLTTGATVRALARQLRAAGVERIEVWACARAL